MKPTPDELAAGVRSLLRPLREELTSKEAGRALQRAMYVLREARWDDAAFDLLNENAKLAAALRRAQQWLNEEAAAPARYEDDARTLAALTADDVLPANFAAANARNLELRTALAGFLDRVCEQDLRASAGLRRELVDILKARHISGPMRDAGTSRRHT